MFVLLDSISLSAGAQLAHGLDEDEHSPGQGELQQWHHLHRDLLAGDTCLRTQPGQYFSMQCWLSPPEVVLHKHGVCV